LSSAVASKVRSSSSSSSSKKKKLAPGLLDLFSTSGKPRLSKEAQSSGELSMEAKTSSKISSSRRRKSVGKKRKAKDYGAGWD
jgi:hypothetical protein